MLYLDRGDMVHEGDIAHHYLGSFKGQVREVYMYWDAGFETVESRRVKISQIKRYRELQKDGDLHLLFSETAREILTKHRFNEKIDEIAFMAILGCLIERGSNPDTHGFLFVHQGSNQAQTDRYLCSYHDLLRMFTISTDSETGTQLVANKKIGSKEIEQIQRKDPHWIRPTTVESVRKIIRIHRFNKKIDEIAWGALLEDLAQPRTPLHVH